MSIVAIDMHIMENGVTFRTSGKDIAVFRTIIDPLKEKGKGKGKEGSGDQESLATTNKTLKDLERLEVAKAILSRLGCTDSQFTASYNQVISAMDKPIHSDRELRTSGILSHRLVSMSALSWNTASRSRPRDWGLTATAFALEAAYIPQYRNKLLADCFGARAVRADLHKLFLSVTEPEMAGTKVVVEWSFADNINLGETGNQASMTSTDTLLKRWTVAKQNFVDGRMHPAQKLIQDLEDHPLLQSTVSGCVESAAAFHISGLAEVCPLSQSLSLLSFLLQIMSAKKAIHDHQVSKTKNDSEDGDESDDENDSEDFDMSTVSISDYPRKPHAVSPAYQVCFYVC